MPLEDLSLVTEDDGSALPELDYLLCRSVEMFSASKEDVEDSAYLEGSCNTVVEGQVGLRCKYCSLSPFATARCATVFPASINHIGPGLRMMAEWHFSRCSMTPSNVREAINRPMSIIQKAKDDGREEEDDSMLLLNEFCASVVANRFNLQNLLPCETGVMCSKSEREERPVETPKQPPFLQSNPRLFRAEDMFRSAASSHHSQQYSSSIEHELSPAQTGPTYSLLRQSRDVVLHNAPIPLPPQIPYPPMDRRMPAHQSNFPPSQPDYLQSFAPSSMGWSCRQCSSVPFQFRAPNSFYPYTTPPTPSFVEYHLQICAGTNFYHSSNQDRVFTQDALNLDAINYLESVSRKDSLLVLEEDRMLLSDYFFYLIKQLQPCYFAESDRKHAGGGKCDNVKVGFAGFECRHCAKCNPTTSRKFFWRNVDRLANSFAEIPNHILNCKNCLERIKKSLHALKVKHPEQIAMLPRGSQKVFFRRMWRRLHVDSATEHREELTQHDTAAVDSQDKDATGLSSSAREPIDESASQKRKAFILSEDSKDCKKQNTS